MRPLVRRLAVVLTASSLGCAGPEPAPPAAQVVAPPPRADPPPAWRSPTRGGELAVSPFPAPVHLERVRLVPPLRAEEGRWAVEVSVANTGPACPFEADFFDERGRHLGVARGLLPTLRAGTTITHRVSGPDESAPVASVRVRPGGPGPEALAREALAADTPRRADPERHRPVDVRLRAALVDVRLLSPTELVQPGTTDERWRVELTYENGGGPSSALVRFLDEAGAPLEELTLRLPTTGTGTSYGQFVIGPDALTPVRSVEVVPAP
jgi:hypothetical protein